MKKKIRFLLGIAFIISLLVFNVKIIDNANDKHSIIISNSASIADVEIPTGYKFCFLGDILPCYSRIGTVAYWCGDCYFYRIWPKSDGYCKLD